MTTLSCTRQTCSTTGKTVLVCKQTQTGSAVASSCSNSNNASCSAWTGETECVTTSSCFDELMKDCYEEFPSESDDLGPNKRAPPRGNAPPRYSEDEESDPICVEDEAFVDDDLNFS